MPPDELRSVATRFVAARRSASALADFPGAVPPDLKTGYLIQDLAIDLWLAQESNPAGTRVAGWKVGRIPVAIEDKMGCDRLAGPMFSPTIYHQESNQVTPMTVFSGGFAAIEAEYIAVIKNDAPVDKFVWNLNETANMIGDLRIGIEIASSPLATINKLGPTVVVSDFGNNAGLIIGPSIVHWATRGLDTFACESFVDKHSVGTGGAYTLTGGYLRSVQFALELAASRGRPLQAGDVIATGQTNGIHEVTPKQQCRVSFGADGDVQCQITAAVPIS